MDWKTTEEIYAEMIRMEKEVDTAFNEAQAANHESRKLDEVYENRMSDYRWMVEDVRELKAELARRANIQP